MTISSNTTLIVGRLSVLAALVGCGSCQGPTDASARDAGDLGDVGSDDAGLDADTTPEDASSDVEAGARVDGGQALRVLFVGNSYTFYNDLPIVAASIAEASGAPIVVDAVTQGGAFLLTHWTTTGARERIESGMHDTVVLQGQSTEPITGSDSFATYAALLSDAARDARADALFFATWARHESSSIYDPDLPDPAAMARALDEGYREAAVANMDGVARVGAAWELARIELPAIALHSDDGSHPAPEGTLLAACVLVQAITGRTPVVPDPVPLGLSRTEAESLCALAPRVRDPAP